MKTVILLVLLLAVAGCGSMSAAARQTAVSEDQNRCAAYGFSANTDAFASCMMQLDQIRSEQNYARRQVLAAGLRALGQSLQQQNRPTVRCNTTGHVYSSGNFGNYNTTTTCR